MTDALSPLAHAAADLRILVAKHAKPGWDDEGALPIHPLAAARTETFICCLPDDLPLPELAPEPDGSISLDSRTRVFSLSVGVRDGLAYAWFDGDEHGHGVAHFDGERAPSVIVDAIRATMSPNGNGSQLAKL